MTKIKTKELRLADVVRSVGEQRSFDTCTVIKVDEQEVTLFRPYIHTPDFSYTGGVIPYIGFEEYKVWRDSDVEWELFSRKELR